MHWGTRQTFHDWMFADYDTKETVTCKATHIYDIRRQRSLQHFLTIEDLPEQFHTVVIPSGGPCSSTAVMGEIRGFEDCISALEL